jgi:hypothetical protein
MTDLNPLKTIVFVPKEEHQKVKVPAPIEGLPSHPFSLGVIGASGTGKTQLVMNLLLRWYRNFFHRVFICSASFETDDTWSILHHGKIPPEQICVDINEVDGFIENIYQEQALPQNNKERRCLLIIDDFASNTKKIKSLNTIARSRHSNLSVIVISQKLIGWIVPGARANLGYLALFNISNGYERKGISSEYSRGLDTNEFLDMFDTITKPKGGFLWLNLRSDDINQYYKKNIYIPIQIEKKHK